MKTLRFGATIVDVVGGEEWYVIVTPPFAAVCNHRGAPHLHRSPFRGDPAHAPALPVEPTLTLPDVLARLRQASAGRRAGLSFQELQEVLS